MLEVKVCVGSSCHIRGAYNVLQTFQQQVEKNALHEKVIIKATFCTKQCQNNVSVSIGDTVYNVVPEKAKSFFEETILPMVQA